MAAARTPSGPTCSSATSACPASTATSSSAASAPTLPAGTQVPAVALTAFARSEDRTRALRAGYAAHVSKPVDRYELLATVASLVGRTGEA